MQGAVAGSGWGASWLCHGRAAPRGSLGCWQLFLGLHKLTLSWMLSVCLSKVGAMCCPMVGTSQGQAPGCMAEGCLPHSEPSSHLLARFVPVSIASPAWETGGVG